MSDAKTEEAVAYDRLIERLRFQLVATGEARLRAGERRTQTKAKKMLEEAAAASGVSVKISKNGSGFIAVVE
jgi:uncharacterized protein with von Willebrand factor type A (vWA) domain